MVQCDRWLLPQYYFNNSVSGICIKKMVKDFR